MDRACPGPVAADIGQGIAWAVPMLAGVLGGVALYLRRDQPETEPATDTAAPQVATAAR